MIQQRHTPVAATIVQELAGESVSAHVRAASAAAAHLYLLSSNCQDGWNSPVELAPQSETWRNLSQAANAPDGNMKLPLRWKESFVT